MKPSSQRARLLCLLFVLLLGFSRQPVQARSGQPTSTIFTIGVLKLSDTLNPLLDGHASSRDATGAIFDSLLAADTHDALQPALAAGYTVSANGLVYQFALDPRARWQDGVPVTADDVLYTAKLMRDPQFPAYNRFGFGAIATLSQTGPTTVTATLRAPYAPFLRAFATTPILPAHVLSPIADASLAHYDAFNRRPIGSGPYSVADYVAADHLTLIANPSYFQGAPRIPQLRFQVMATPAAALAALRNGTVQMLGPSAGLTPRLLLSTLQSGGFSAYAAPGYGWTHIDLIESGFLRDHVVRQALTLATPRQRLVSALFGGLATPADADQPPTSQYFEPSIAGSLTYDPAKVPALLKSRGYRRVHGVWTKFGHTLGITLWTDSGCADCVAAARSIAASWTAAGMPSAVHATNQHKLFGLHGPLYSASRLFSSSLNAVLYTWATSAEPDDSYYWATSMIVHPDHLTGGNFDGYSNPQVDRLTNLALSTPDEGKRIAIYRRIQRLLVHDQPDIFLYWTADLSVAVRTLHGYRANPYAPSLTWNAAQWSVG